MSFSLRRTLSWLWVLLTTLLLALGFIVYGLFDLGVGAQVRQAQAQLAAATDDAARRYAELARNGINVDEQTRARLEMMITIALANRQRIEGGFWERDAGSLAYAFPTHDGPAVKTDLPAAELNQIKSVIEKGFASQKRMTGRFDGQNSTLLLEAQPLSASVAVWSMTRVSVDVGEMYQRLALALGVPLVLALGSGIWLAFLLRSWTKRVGNLEHAIANAPLEKLELAPTGERDLDRVVEACNRLRARLQTAQREQAHSARLAAVGNISAGLAHEIGNPLGAMRLRAENALSGDGPRAQEALRTILDQIARLEELLGGLRLLTNTADVRPEPVALGTFLRERMRAIEPRADEAGVRLDLRAPATADAQWRFDEKSMARAVENLLLNAVQHTPRDGRVTLSAELSENICCFRVSDDGPGVPAKDATKIFEPFVTTRADGTGLGLALVREIALAHGGDVRLEKNDARGATFVIEIPSWQKS